MAGLKKNYSQPWFISWECVAPCSTVPPSFSALTRPRHLSRSIFFNTRMTRAEFQSKVAKRFEDGEVPPSVVNGPNELAAPPTSKRNGIALKEKVN